MPVITLPDGSQRSFERAGQRRRGRRQHWRRSGTAALAGRVDGRLVDTSFVIDRRRHGQHRHRRDPEGLEIIRHSTAHLLAQAVKQLFPEAQVTIGPVIEDGFYYDFAYQAAVHTEDLAAIEARMNELAKADETVTRRVLPRDEAVQFFREPRRALQGRDHRSDPAERADQPLRPGRLGGSVPRSARALDRQAAGPSS